MACSLHLIDCCCLCVTWYDINGLFSSQRTMASAAATTIWKSARSRGPYLTTPRPCVAGPRRLCASIGKWSSLCG